MTKYGRRVVEADTLSDAWLETVELVSASPTRKMFHTYTTIGNPLAESNDIRARCEALLASRGMPPVETVAGTIFPAAVAETSASPAALVGRYQQMYPTIRRFNGNHKGTYFGRLVSYPGAAGPVDQLGLLIEKLRSEAAQAGPMSARYEVNVAATADLEPDQFGPVAFAHTETDNGRRAFPCLSMMSFHLDHNVVHMLAHYRYEYLVERAYGNYLGLARLLRYVATNAGLRVGYLTIVAGRVQLDAPDAEIERHLHSALFDV